MRRWKFLFAIVPFVCVFIWWTYTEIEKSRANVRDQSFREMLEWSRDVRAGEPRGSVGVAWANCLERLEAGFGDLPQRTTCETVAGQGVTSALVALELDGEYIPVVESRITDVAIEGRLVVDVVGGPGDEPFYSNPAVTVEMVEKLRGNGAAPFLCLMMKERPHYQLMQRGFTIASVAYWGTSVRTLAAPDEIQSAIREVGLVIDHYRDELDRDPPLITASLGNHLVLGALGKERLQAMHVLSLVPVMDGLQHHIKNKMVDEDWTSPDILSGEWVWRNIYKRADKKVTFDHRRMIDQRKFVPRYVGEIDLPWRNIQPETACSTIVLGDSDPRTAAYLAGNDDLPPYLQVWESDHYLYGDAPQRSRVLFAEFADCLVGGQNSPDRLFSKS